MIITDQPQVFGEYLARARQGGASVGLHPTMGALHGGHKANISRASAECDVVAVTIFVNPLQFGPAEDFTGYPRRFEDDAAHAEEAGADILLHPSPEAMFPGGLPPSTTVKVRGLTERWEGAHRPGHFEGVATIVTKLFALAGPCYAYFGEKDYQQLLVVERLTQDLSLPVAIVPCATVREPDGLALSSRNAYLGPAQRAAAPSLYWALLAGKRAIEEEAVTDAPAVRGAMTEVMGKQDQFVLDYAEVVNPSSLEPLSSVQGPAHLLIAARCSTARLIDNVPAGDETGKQSDEA